MENDCNPEILNESNGLDPVQNALDDDWTPDEMRSALARSSKENGWDESGMELYDEYDKHAREPR